METKSALITPYEGKEAYVFVSYSHRDKDRVFPLLRTMAENGCRIWYDEGIDPGTEWPESIARHLEDSAVCLAVISENSLLSANCRREINFAVSRNKPFLSVVLEPVKMSPGMELQVSSYQSLLRYKYANEADFIGKLLSLDVFRSCRTAPESAAPETRETAPETEDRSLSVTEGEETHIAPALIGAGEKVYDWERQDRKDVVSRDTSYYLEHETTDTASPDPADA